MQTRSKRACGRLLIKMDQGLWSKLPAELLERVLPFLLVPDLCRFRIVCKRWNNLICSPEFGKLCKSANETSCLVVKLRFHSKATHSWRELPGWSILDLNEKRWYNLKHELPKGYDDISTMDGGLVCAYVDSFTEEQRRAPNCIPNPKTNADQTLVMFNLFGGDSKVLPNPPLPDADLHELKLHLILDNTSNTFKNFLMVVGFYWNPVHSCVYLYESSTDQWRNLPNPPGSMCPHWRSSYDLRRVIFQGLLYCLYESADRELMLCSFNFLEESWEDTGVQFPHSDMRSSYLVVSDNRLFLMTALFLLEGEQERLGPPGWPLDISEILLAEEECRTVVRMKQSEVIRSLEEKTSFFYKLSAFGFNKSILVMSPKTGKAMLYNLATGQWESLPQNPLDHPDYRGPERSTEAWNTSELPSSAERTFVRACFQIFHIRFILCLDEPELVNSLERQDSKW